jgi:hypothetical protein
MFVPAGQPHGMTGTWSNITFTAHPTSAKNSSWGNIKALYR